MSSYVQLFLITATTVGKILLCALAGAFASRSFDAPQKSEKGLSYISVRILLPCLLFSNLCLSVTVSSLRRFYWAPLLACLPMSVGLASSFLFRIILKRKYHALIMLGCTFQNGLTFPLSIVLNLKGISWLDKQAVNEAQSHIFLYNILCSIGLWAVGEPLIAAAKAKEVRVEEEAFRARERARERRQDRLRGVGGEALANRSFIFPFHEATVAEQTGGDRRGRSSSSSRPSQRRQEDGAEGAAGKDSDGDPGVEDERGKELAGHEEVDGQREAQPRKRSATATEQLAWYKPAKPYDRPLVPPKPAAVYTDDHGIIIALDVEEEDAVRRNQCSAKRVKGILVRSFKSPTVFFSLVGIAVSLMPPLRWVAESFVGQCIIGGLTVVGSGAIPLQLLVLGCTIAMKNPSDDEAQGEAENGQGSVMTASEEEEGEEDLPGRDPAEKPAGTAASPSTPTAAAFLCPRVKPSTLFVLCTITLRMVLLPAICFLVIHLLNAAGLLPRDRPFLLAMLVATSSPSAINSSVICSMHSYYSKEYARMVLTMYTVSIFTTAVYLFFYILYLGW